MYGYLTDIIAQPSTALPSVPIGFSRQGRPILGYVFGKGDLIISLIGGCHADEPVGPILLKKLVNYLAGLPHGHELLTGYYWSIVPHTNPDGEAINKAWYEEQAICYDLFEYLKYSKRELPGDDIEFGFPISPKVPPLRIENKVVHDFWKSQGKIFDVHASLHGMGRAYGPWFLIDANWAARSAYLQDECTLASKQLGYHELHDMDRNGEKGFTRISKGFCTRPDAGAMREYFIEKGDHHQAGLFHASSMESIRAFGGDCLTLVTEMPLFLLPKKTSDISWPNAEWEVWNKTFMTWGSKIIAGTLTKKRLQQEMNRMGIKPMPICDQMKLQWKMLCAGIKIKSCH